MQSGSPQTTVDILSGQRNYDSLVNDVGCAKAHDTLDCLRDVPYEKLKQGVEVLSPGMFTYKVGEWLPTAVVATDGHILGLIADMANHC